MQKGIRMGNTIKAVTFNIRCDYGQDGENGFPFRQNLIREAIHRERPHIIGFQEVLPHVASWLKDTFSEYYFLGCGREKDLSGEQALTAVLKSRFQMIQLHTFWLSPSPKEPGSRYREQSSCPRTCTELLLQDTESLRLYHVLNTHLDHEGCHARILAMKQLLKHIHTMHDTQPLYTDSSLLFMGDFNAGPDEPEIRLLLDDGFLTDLTEGLPGTFHDYGRLSAPQKIDYIMADSSIKCLSRSLWTKRQDGLFLSDHYPVCVEIMN